MRNRGVISHPVISEAARLFQCTFCMCIYLSIGLSFSLQGMFTACYFMPTVSPFRKERAWLFPYVLSARSDVLTAVGEDWRSEMRGPLGGHVSLSHWRGGPVCPGTCPFVLERSKLSSPCRDTKNYVLDNMCVCVCVHIHIYIWGGGAIAYSWKAPPTFITSVRPSVCWSVPSACIGLCPSGRIFV
jgi:hypothetical protein